MKTYLTEWKRFLAEERADEFERNFKIIVSELEVLTTASSGYYEEMEKLYGEDRESKLKEILSQPETYKILKDYRIKSKLGSGAIGTAFNLDSPHEDYVLKFQITEGEYGIRFIEDLFNRQDKGKFNPNEIRVLDFSKTKLDSRLSYKRNDVYLYLYVVSKVEQKNIGGKTGKTHSIHDFMLDLEIMGIPELCVYLKHIDKGTETGNERKEFKMMTQIKEPELDKLVEIYKSGSLKKTLRYLHSVAGHRLRVSSKEQFVSLAKELIERYKEAVATGREHFDFKGENVGFRPNSDVLLPFDI